MVVMESDSQHDIGGTFSSLHMPNVVRIWQELAHLTPNTPQIQLWCAWSKLNMDEIFNFKIHLRCVDVPKIFLLKSLNAQ